MKKHLSFLLSLCIVLSMLTLVNPTSVSARTFTYYMKEYRKGKMKDGPGSMIGDPSFNNKIDAEDALRVLYFLSYGSAHSPAFEPPTTPEELQSQANQGLWRMEAVSMDYYKRGWHIYDWDKKNWGAELGITFTTWYIFQSYTRNAYFLCDVSNDCKLGADDALMILQYVVGKRDSFPRTDYHGEGNFQYMHPIEEWYPTKYYDVRYNMYGRLAYPNAYDAVADIFPDIPPLPAE